MPLCMLKLAVSIRHLGSLLEAIISLLKTIKSSDFTKKRHFFPTKKYLILRREWGKGPINRALCT